LEQKVKERPREHHQPKPESSLEDKIFHGAHLLLDCFSSKKIYFESRKVTLYKKTHRPTIIYMVPGQ